MSTTVRIAKLIEAEVAANGALLPETVEKAGMMIRDATARSDWTEARKLNEAMREKVLQAIAQGKCPDPPQCARRALAASRALGDASDLVLEAMRDRDLGLASTRNMLLREAVMRAIAEGKCSDARACCLAALRISSPLVPKDDSA